MGEAQPIDEAPVSFRQVAAPRPVDLTGPAAGLGSEEARALASGRGGDVGAGVGGERWREWEGGEGRGGGGAVGSAGRGRRGRAGGGRNAATASGPIDSCPAARLGLVGWAQLCYGRCMGL
jgi:hypothetical protein